MAERFPAGAGYHGFRGIGAARSSSAEDDEPPKGGGTVEKTVSITDPDCGMFVKGEHGQQFAYEAHTACDSKGFVLGVEVTAGNVHDSVAWDKVYDEVTQKYAVEFVAMDAGYKTPWIAKKILGDNKTPVLPYTQYKGDSNRYKPWEYTCDAIADAYICPQGGWLPPHIWQEYLDLVEQIRKADRGKDIYAKRKETIEQVFAGCQRKPRDALYTSPRLGCCNMMGQA